MLANLYTIRDSLAEESAPPFMSKNDVSAVRSYRIGLADAPYTEGYQLLKIGQFDTETTILTPICPPEVILVPEEEKSNV